MRADRLKLLLLLALFAAPGLAAWLVRDHWRPTAISSHGQLLEPFASGLDLPRGQWVLLTVAPGGCADDCRHQLYLTRQVRAAQGREQERVERALLGSLGMDAPVEPGLRQVAAAPTGGSGFAGDGVRTYVVDPQGRVMLRFPAQPDGKGMIRDLSRLLKASAGGVGSG